MVTPRMEPTDHELILRFVRDGSESAFGELTRRHLSLVYATAHRVVGDPETARDVAQTVFTDLARKAPHWDPDTVVPAWLYRATTFAAAKARRCEQRRAQRESEAMRRHTLNAERDPEIDALLPLLDQGLARLSETDREALILRFLSGQSLRSIGETLGVGEDAARKRVERALDRLRQLLKLRGHTVSTTTLALALGIAASDVASPALAASIAGIVSAGATTMGWTLATSLGIGALVAVAGLELLLASRSREIHSLKLQSQARHPGVAPEIASATAAPWDPEKELLQLRQRAEALRRSPEPHGSGDAIAAAPTGASASPLLLGMGVAIPTQQLVEAGAESPLHSVQSFFAAAGRHDLERFLKLAPSIWDGSDPDSPASLDNPDIQLGFDNLKRQRIQDGLAIQLERVEYTSDNSASVIIQFRDIPSSKEVSGETMKLIRTENGWVIKNGGFQHYLLDPEDP